MADSARVASDDSTRADSVCFVVSGVMADATTASAAVASIGPKAPSSFEIC